MSKFLGVSANTISMLAYKDLQGITINEKGWRRSFGINQFMYGCILELNEDGIESLKDI